MHTCSWVTFTFLKWQPTSVLLPGKSHGQRSLVATVHGVMKSQTQLSDFTFTFHFHALEKEKEMSTHSSVLAWRIPGTEEPWWAAVYGVAQIRTKLKWLSRSSSIMSAKNIDKKYGNMLIWRLRNFIFFHGLHIQKVKEREEKYRFGSWTPSDILLLLFKTAKIVFFFNF